MTVNNPNEEGWRDLHSVHGENQGDPRTSGAHIVKLTLEIWHSLDRSHERA